MAYTRIPQSNTTRNENQMRSVVDSMKVVKANVIDLADKMAQMYLDGGSTRVAQEFNIADESEAQQIYDLISSLNVEIKDQSPFYNQTIQRLS